jgi:hypothetical protein
MDETSRLRDLLDGATAGEPPIGHLVRNSLQAGVGLRRRRRVTGAVFSGVAVIAVIAVVAAAVPALVGRSTVTPSAGHGGHGGHGGQGKTAYIATITGTETPFDGGNTVVPVNTATGKAGEPITVPHVVMVTAAPNGRTVYALSLTDGGDDGALIPIRTATNTALKPIQLGPMIANHSSTLAITPNGRAGYLADPATGILPIDLATDTALKPMTLATSPWLIAVSPNGKTVYAISDEGTAAAVTVTAIDTGTDTVLPPIKLKVSARVLGGPDSIAFTPNGKTAYVLVGVQLGRPYSSSVSPINTHTNTAGNPIMLRQPGIAEKIVMSPNGKMAYVLSASAVTPISVATNTALAPIGLPASEGNAYNMVVTPDGKTLYVISHRGITAISTATRKVQEISVLDLGSPYPDHFAPIAVTPDGRTVYVGTKSGVAAIDTVDNAVGPYISLSAITGEGEAQSIAFAR